MIHKLCCVQYSSIVCGRLCYCRNKDHGVGWDHEKNITEYESCEFYCCNNNELQQIFKYWSTSVSGWMGCFDYWLKIKKNTQEIQIKANIKPNLHNKKND